MTEISAQNLKTHLFGEQHQALKEWLTGRWLKDGPPIAAIQGFPGLGKTAIAESVIAELARRSAALTIVHIDCPISSASLVDDLVLNLAEELDAKGDSEFAEALAQGSDATGLLRKLLNRPRLIVLDEAQRLMGESDGVPRNKQIEQILEQLSHAIGSPGRLLLLSSREFGGARWEERADTVTLNPFMPKDAQKYLTALLESDGRTEAIPADRIDDVASWLGGNARAIHLLVSALRRETLDYLIGLAPEAWEARDRQVSVKLLREFETRVLTRAVDQLDGKTELFLRRLAVFRKPVPRNALESVATADVDMETSRDELLARYIIEFRTGHYRVHPIVRDTLLQKFAPAQKRNAHLIAGNYFAKAFRAKQMVGHAEALGARFVEARYHFMLAESEKDLLDIAGRFEQHLRAQFSFVTPIPTDPQELDERIALLSALLKDRGSHGLEYHLARCLIARDRAQDSRLALPHLRRSTGPKSPASAWVLRIQIEAKLSGPDQAAKVAREGIEVVPPTQNLFSLYQAAAEILARDGKADEAVALLRKGYRQIGDRSNGYRLAENAGLVALDFGRFDLVQGFEMNPMQELFLRLLNQISDEDFAGASALGDAGIKEAPRYLAIYTQCAFAAAAAGDINRAKGIIGAFPLHLDLSKGTTIAWLLALIEFRGGDIDKAKQYLNVYSGGDDTLDAISINTFLDAWRSSCQEYGSALSYHFPRIPKAISGLDYVLVRHDQINPPSGLIPTFGTLGFVLR